MTARDMSNGELLSEFRACLIAAALRRPRLEEMDYETEILRRMKGAKRRKPIKEPLSVSAFKEVADLAKQLYRNKEKQQ